MKICWLTIHVKNLAASQKFYGDYLGLELTRFFHPEPHMTIVFYSDGKGMEIELIHSEQGEAVSVSSPVTIGFRTHRFDALMNTAKQCEMQITNGPLSLGPDCYCFFVNDPDGICVQIIRE